MAREKWKEHRQPGMRLEPDRLVFIDETGTTTKITRLRGHSLKGQRLRSKAPFGHWKTQTSVAGLRSSGLTAPFVVDQRLNRCIFEVYVETQLALTLKSGDIVIKGNLAAHKSLTAEAEIRAKGAWVLFLPPYSPDINPIEMPSPSSKHTCAPGSSEPSRRSGRPESISAISSHQQNAKTTSTQPDMDAHENPTL